MPLAGQHKDNKNTRPANGRGVTEVYDPWASSNGYNIYTINLAFVFFNLLSFLDIFATEKVTLDLTI